MPQRNLTASVLQEAQMLTFKRKPSLGISSAISLALGACGGGGGGVANSTPPPPPTPTPTAASVTIFKNPMPGEFVTVGASMGTSGSGATYPGADSRFGPLSTNSASQPLIRYT